MQDENAVGTVNLPRSTRTRVAQKAVRTRDDGNDDDDGAVEALVDATGKSLGKLAIADIDVDDSAECAPDAARAQLIKEAVGAVAKATDLLFGVDKDIENLPEKRSRRASRREPLSGVESLKIKYNTDPDTVSLGYGEITPGGFGKIMKYLLSGVPEDLRIGTGSSFIDIGSGFGKLVFQVPLWVPGANSTGIEYGQLRHDKAVEVAQLLRKRGGDWAARLENVELIQGDATELDYAPFTHIFMYDYIFSECTHRALLPRIAKADFQIFACFCNERKLRKLGFDADVDLELLQKFSVGNTGKQNHTVFIYRKAEPDADANP
jgi:Histone methylation protein DOT1